MCNSNLKLFSQHVLGMFDATHPRRREKILLPGMVAQYSRNGLPPLHDLFMNTKEVFRPGDYDFVKFANALKEDPEKAMRLCLWFGDNNARGDRSNMNRIMPDSLKRNGFTDEERKMIKGGPLKRKVAHPLFPMPLVSKFTRPFF